DDGQYSDDERANFHKSSCGANNNPEFTCAPPYLDMTRVLIVGGGFAGLNAAKIFGRSGGIDVTLIDRRNYHLFQPLLYQVATAGLSPADIAAPIRSILSHYSHITVLLDEVRHVDLDRN